MKLDPISGLFAAAWSRFRERLGTLTAVFAVPMVLILIAGLLNAHGGLAAGALGGLIQLLGVIVSIVASVAVIVVIADGSDFAAAYRAGLSRFWGVIWITILTILAVVGGYFMLIIPGIMITIQLSFGSMVFVLEDRRGMAALVRSRDYIKGYWWAFFGRLLGIGLVFAVPSAILILPARILFGATGAVIVDAIISLFLGPFIVAYEYEIYKNLQRLKPELAAVDDEKAMRGDSGFLKVAMVVGIVGSILLIVLFCALIFWGLAGGPWQNGHTNQYSWRGNGGAGTLSNTAQLSPTSGAVGSMVTITDEFANVDFDATNTILMNGYVASRDVTLGVGGSLTFAVPQSLAPDCAPQSPCPQFLMLVTSGTAYDVSVENVDGTTDIGMFTVTGGSY